MTKNRYTITEAANMLGLRTHTLRYWEEELELEIPRNEMGHRVYYQEEIDRFQMIRRLKEQGYQLTAIRMQLQDKFPVVIPEEMPTEEQRISACNQVKLEQFQMLMNEVVRNAMEENNALICSQVEQRILKEMNYLAQEQEEQIRKQYQQLDKTIRQFMQSKQNKLTFFSRKKEAVTKCSPSTNTL